jgi:hypothetical protein
MIIISLIISVEINNNSMINNFIPKFKSIYFIQSTLYKITRLVICLLIVFSLSCCSSLVKVDPPYTYINKDNVFNNESTATSALTYIYMDLSRNNFSQTPYISSIYLFGGLLADELTLYDLSNSNFILYYYNALNQNMNIYLWNNAYTTIFDANSAIEGLSDNTILSKAVTQQLLGEAKFIRGFCYFYLVNTYGNVPIVLGTDPLINATLERSDVDKVYSQIISDLKDASDLLSDDFRSGNVSISTSDRVRPSKWAAKALLARTYLFHGDYALAEESASEVINNSALFQLDSLDNVFLINSKESIWQLQNVNNYQGNTGEGNLFVLPSGGPNTDNYPIYLSHHVVESFEEEDQRKSHWLDTVMDDKKNIYYYANKYKSGALTPAGKNTEYETVFRLGEQYLIRAEARARLNRLTEAEADLNVIRKRAGLKDFNGLTADNLVEVILHERQVELFTEWGHRWFDLKRTGKINDVMSSVTAEKGGIWNANWAYWPLNLSELLADPKLAQNNGY